jgi:hypothetical protein
MLGTVPVLKGYTWEKMKSLEKVAGDAKGTATQNSSGGVAGCGQSEVKEMGQPVQRIADALDRIAAVMEKQAKAAGSMIASIPPEGLSKEDAARFIGEDVASVEHLIKTRKLDYVQHGSQRGRVIPVESLRKFLKTYLQRSMGHGNGRH